MARSLAGPVVSASTIEVLCPSLRMTELCPCIRQGACNRALRSRHFSSILMERLRASKGATSFSREGSVSFIERTAERYLSSRARSSDAWFRSWELRTNAPGRPLTALTSVLKSPPVSGARNTSTCCAPSGTVTVRPSWAHLPVHVLQGKNQLSGGGLVEPLKNAATIK